MREYPISTGYARGGFREGEGVDKKAILGHIEAILTLFSAPEALVKITVLDVIVDFVVGMAVGAGLLWLLIGHKLVPLDTVLIYSGAYAGIGWLMDLVRGRGWRYASASAVATFAGAALGGLFYGRFIA